MERGESLRKNTRSLWVYSSVVHFSLEAIMINKQYYTTVLLYYCSLVMGGGWTVRVQSDRMVVRWYMVQYCTVGGRRCFGFDLYGGGDLGVPLAIYFALSILKSQGHIIPHQRYMREPCPVQICSYQVYESATRSNINIDTLEQTQLPTLVP